MLPCLKDIAPEPPPVPDCKTTPELPLTVTTPAPVEVVILLLPLSSSPLLFILPIVPLATERLIDVSSGLKMLNSLLELYPIVASCVPVLLFHFTFTLLGRRIFPVAN